MVRLFLFLSAISVMLTWSIDGASQNNTFKGKVDPRIDSALTMMHEGDRKTATVIIDEMLDEDSLNVYALVLLAQMDNEFDQNYSAALLTLKHAYAIDTNNLLVVKALSQQLLNMDRGKEAMRILENCEISKWDSDMIILMAMAVNSDSSLRTNKSAEHLLATAIRDSEENRLELIQPLASMYLTVNKDSALYYYHMYIALMPESADGYLSLSNAYTQLGESGKAKSVLYDGLEKCSEPDRLYFKLAQLYYQENDLGYCSHFLEEAIRINRREEYVAFRGELNYSLGLEKLALPDLREILLKKPWNLEYLRTVANIEINEGNNDDALSIVLKSVRYNNSLADSCASLLMKLYFAEAKFDSAYYFLKKFNISNSLAFSTKYICAVLLSVNGRVDESLLLCKLLVSGNMNLNNEEVFNLKGLMAVIYLWKKDYSKFYEITDDLYKRYGALFIESLVSVPAKIKKGERWERKIVIIPKGNSEYVVAVATDEVERKLIMRRYKN